MSRTNMTQSLWPQLQSAQNTHELSAAKPWKRVVAGATGSRQLLSLLGFKDDQILLPQPMLESLKVPSCLIGDLDASFRYHPSLRHREPCTVLYMFFVAKKGVYALANNKKLSHWIRSSDSKAFYSRTVKEFSQPQELVQLLLLLFTLLYRKKTLSQEKATISPISGSYLQDLDIFLTGDFLDNGNDRTPTVLEHMSLAFCCIVENSVGASPLVVQICEVLRKWHEIQELPLLSTPDESLKQCIKERISGLSHDDTSTLKRLRQSSEKGLTGHELSEDWVVVSAEEEDLDMGRMLMLG